MSGTAAAPCPHSSYCTRLRSRQHGRGCIRRKKEAWKEKGKGEGNSFDEEESNSRSWGPPCALPSRIDRWQPLLAVDRETNSVKWNCLGISEPLQMPAAEPFVFSYMLEFWIIYAKLPLADYTTFLSIYMLTPFDN